MRDTRSYLSALALIALAGGATACLSGSSRTTVRLIDGQAQETKFVSPGAYQHYLAAQIAQQRRDYATAEQHYKLALVHDERSPYLLTRLAENLAIQGRPRQALGSLDRALELAPNFPDALILKGRLLLRDQRASQAEALLKRAIKQNPRHPPGYLAYSEMLQRLDRAPEARKVLGRLVTMAPASVEGHGQLSILCLRQMDYPCAIKHLEEVLQRRGDLDTLMRLAHLHRGLGQLPQAIKYLREAFDRSGGNLEVAEVLMEVLEQAQLPLEVLDLQGVLKASLDDDPGRTASLARMLLKQRYAAAALALVEHQLQHDDLSELHILRGVALLEMGRSGPGEALLRQHLSGERGAVAARALARHLWSNARTAAAVDLLRGALAGGEELALIPDYASALYFDGQPAAAVAAIQQVLKKRPEHRGLRFTLGMALERAGRAGEAVKVMKGLIKADPHDAAAHNFIGYSLVEHGGDLKQAERSIRRALFLHPGEGYIIDSLGWLTFKRGELQKARELLAMAVRLSPREAEVIAHLAEVCVAMNDHQAASAFYQRAYTAAEDPVLARELKARRLALTKGATSK